MAEPADLLRAWRDVIDQLRAVAPVPDYGRLADALTAPLQRQAELLEQALAQQRDLERRVVDRLAEPVRVAFDALEQTSAAMRTQAEAMQAAAAALKQAGELLDLQAGMVERATGALRDPAAILRSAVRGGDAPGGGGQASA